MCRANSVLVNVVQLQQIASTWDGSLRERTSAVKVEK